MNVLTHKNESYNLDSIFSSCHPTILHGAYDSGSAPRVVLFSAIDSEKNEVSFISIQYVVAGEQHMYTELIYLIYIYSTTPI